MRQSNRQNKSTARSAADFEPLESRTMLSGTPLGISLSGGTQLNITGTAGSDQITISRASKGRLLIQNTGGWATSVRAAGVRGIWIDGGAGNDRIMLDRSITQKATLYGSDGNDVLIGGSGSDKLYGGTGANRVDGEAGDDTIVTVGGLHDSLTGGLGTDSFWSSSSDRILDATTAERRAGAVHRIGTFISSTVQSNAMRGFSTGSNSIDLADPTLTSSSFSYSNFSNSPLFSEAGPSANDIRQGAVGDCYFLSVLSSVAKVDPMLIKQSVVELGDGTYAVQFRRNGSSQFVRVDADLATSGGGRLAYAGAGAQGSIWVAIMEKAFTFFRSSAATYSSIGGGWMSEVYAALGKQSCGSYGSANAAWLMNTISSAISSGKSVTFAVNNPASGAPLIGSHAYMVDAVTRDASGHVTGLRLRNPWGIDGAGRDGKNDGYVTVTAEQAQQSFLGLTTAAV